MGIGNFSQTSNALAADARSLNALKLQAGQNTPAAIKESAKQLESLFMRELIKSMRDATMKSGLLDSKATWARTCSISSWQFRCRGCLAVCLI